MLFDNMRETVVMVTVNLLLVKAEFTQRMTWLRLFPGLLKSGAGVGSDDVTRLVLQDKWDNKLVSYRTW